MELHHRQRTRAFSQNPRNAGTIDQADADATVGNITCGDALRLMVRLDADGRIADAKFQTFGCASAILSSGAPIELIKPGFPGWASAEDRRRPSDDSIADRGIEKRPS